MFTHWSLFVRCKSCGHQNEIIVASEPGRVWWLLGCILIAVAGHALLRLAFTGGDLGRLGETSPLGGLGEFALFWVLFAAPWLIAWLLGRRRPCGKCGRRAQ